MLKRGDAFLLGLLPFEIGIPYMGLALLSSVEREGGAPKLQQRARAQGEAFRARAVDVLRMVKEVEALAARSGLAVPMRPSGHEEFLAWVEQLKKSVDAAAPLMPEGAGEGESVMLGRQVGEIFQSVTLELLADWMLESSPEQTSLRGRAEALAKRVGQLLPELEKLIEQKGSYAFPGEACRIGLRIPVAVRAAPALDGEGAAGVSVRLAGVKSVMQRLMREIGDLRAAFEGAR